MIFAMDGRKRREHFENYANRDHIVNVMKEDQSFFHKLKTYDLNLKQHEHTLHEPSPGCHRL